MKRSPEIENKILDLIRAGNSSDVAALANKVGSSTLKQWMREDPDFADAVRYARASAESDYVGILRNGAAVDPKLAVEWLKRARWKTWEPAKRIEAKVTAQAAKMTPEQLESRRLEIARELVEMGPVPGSKLLPEGSDPDA